MRKIMVMIYCLLVIGSAMAMQGPTTTATNIQEDEYIQAKKIYTVNQDSYYQEMKRFVEVESHHHKKSLEIFGRASKSTPAYVATLLNMCMKAGKFPEVEFIVTTHAILQKTYYPAYQMAKILEQINNVLKGEITEGFVIELPENAQNLSLKIELEVLRAALAGKNKLFMENYRKAKNKDRVGVGVTK